MSDRTITPALGRIEATDVQDVRYVARCIVGLTTDVLPGVAGYSVKEPSADDLHRICALANAALPDGDPRKCDWFQDTHNVTYFVETVLDAIERGIRDTHRGAPEYRIQEELEPYKIAAKPVLRLVERITALLPPAP